MSIALPGPAAGVECTASRLVPVAQELRRPAHPDAVHYDCSLSAIPAECCSLWRAAKRLERLPMPASIKKVDRNFVVPAVVAANKVLAQNLQARALTRRIRGKPVSSHCPDPYLTLSRAEIQGIVGVNIT
ncbi:MAG TPA: hypothetical protein VGN97_02790 [Mesorhizobium sp.]|nr:hypothetical protein [Mesorhizobium sp.]